MEMKHLSDEQIQDYLDGNPRKDQIEIEVHLESCGQCREELERYRVLSQTLSEDPGFELSSGFAADVIAGMEESAAESFFFKVARVVLWMVGIAVSFGIAIYFTNMKMVVEKFKLMQAEGQGIFDSIWAALQNLFAGSHNSLTLFALAALVIVGIALLDRMLKRFHREVTCF
jgi:anti-sigma factor RsiW